MTYIPRRGPPILLRTFIAALLEMLRRWQWNFCLHPLVYFPVGSALCSISADRLENEHIGNMDQYRVTREVPLPYTIEDMDTMDEDEETGSKKSWIGLRRRRPTPHVHDEESENDRQAPRR